MQLKLSGLHGLYRINRFQIDHSNCNAYTIWQETGIQNDLNQAELEWIYKNGRLKPLCPEEKQNIQGYWQQDILLTDNALTLIELTPVKKKINL